MANDAASSFQHGGTHCLHDLLRASLRPVFVYMNTYMKSDVVCYMTIGRF